MRAFETFVERTSNLLDPEWSSQFAVDLSRIGFAFVFEAEKSVTLSSKAKLTVLLAAL